MHAVEKVAAVALLSVSSLFAGMWLGEGIGRDRYRKLYSTPGWYKAELEVMRAKRNLRAAEIRLTRLERQAGV